MSKSPKKTEKEIINHDIDIYQEKPGSADMEILCGRAAKLAYLSAHDLNALFYDVTEDSSICSQPYSTLETVGPLLQSRDPRTVWPTGRPMTPSHGKALVVFIRETGPEIPNKVSFWRNYNS